MEKYIVVEHFKAGKIKEVYRRFDEKGRMLPKGVHYIDSWIDENVKTCYQLMESESLALLQQWINRWDDLVDFEIVPVIGSAEAKARVLKELN